MKKLVVFTLLLLLICGIINANEISFYYSSKRIEKNVNSQRYWHLKDLYLGWKGENCATSINIKNLAETTPKLDIEEAYVNFNILTNYFSPFEIYEWFTLDLAIGKMLYPFGAVSEHSSKNISIFQPTSLGSDWMVNLMGELCKQFYFSVYWVDGGTAEGINGYDAPSKIGFRTQYSSKDLDLGASLRIKDWDQSAEDSERAYDYGLDMIYLLQEMIKFNVQIFNIDDNDDDTSDLNFFAITSYVKGFELPFVKKTIPYCGIFSKRELKNNTLLGDGAKENNIILGLHMQPLTNAFIKIEGNIESNINKNSLELLDQDNYNVSNALSVEVGFVF